MLGLYGMCGIGLYSMLEFKLCLKFSCCMVDMDRWIDGILWSEQY